MLYHEFWDHLSIWVMLGMGVGGYIAGLGSGMALCRYLRPYLCTQSEDQEDQDDDTISSKVPVLPPTFGEDDRRGDLQVTQGSSEPNFLRL